jgi:hypothetical protein
MTHLVADMLGAPERVIVDVEPGIKQIRLTPATPDNSGAFALSGGGNASYRVKITDATRQWPQLVGEYTPQKYANGILLRKKEEIK